MKVCYSSRLQAWELRTELVIPRNKERSIANMNFANRPFQSIKSKNFMEDK